MLAMPKPMVLPALASPWRGTHGPLITRFAPSPTGHLHLGHVLSMIYVWGVGRRLGADIILRIEDHDRSRARRAHEAAILDETAWLGFQPDRGVAREDQPSPWRQSDHPGRFHEALRRLDEQGLVYACDCSRQRLASLPRSQSAGELVYDGHCRERGLARHGCGLRLRVPPGAYAADDLWLGPLRQDPAEQCGDILLQDRLGQWTYQFAVVVDDIHEDVNLVIRGQDLTASVGRQLLLRRQWRDERPVLFLHHPLLMGADGHKLSKRQRSESVSAWRDRGATSADVIGHVAWLGGLINAKRPLTATEVSRLFEVP